jgi:N6-adenosine-specific RNA methylase IME4
VTRELAIVRRDPVLARLDIARSALAKAQTIQAVKQIADLATAAKVYARQQKLGQESIGFANAVKVEALRRLGEILKQTERNKGGAGRLGGGTSGTQKVPLLDAPPTLADEGLTKKESALAQKLASLPVEQFEQVKEGTASVAKALREVERARRPTIVLPTTDTYRVIYADPPWSYSNSGVINDDNYGHVARHYPSMTIKELCAMPVRKIVDGDAVLFLWVTSPLLAECFAVVDAWGFTYKTSFVWDKVRHNFGHYNSVRHELLLICTRGSCTPDVPTLIDSVVTIERSDVHSQKPERFREIIDELYPRGARVELFARRDPPDPWRAWGNEPAAVSA